MAIGLGVTFKTACLSLGSGSASSPPYTYIYVSIFLGSTCAGRTPPAPVLGTEWFKNSVNFAHMKINENLLG